ncbi:hypothetical protein ACFORG_20240, partial [Lutimaribacter marinistellae]
FGQWGDDRLFGGNNADRLDGGIGNDTMTGGLGADVFVFNTVFNTGTDLITGWGDGFDRIEIAGPVTQGGTTITSNASGTLISWAGGSVQVDHATPGIVTFADIDFV